MPMMRFTRPLINAGLKMASLGKKIAIGLLIVITVFIAGRIYETQRGPALHPWHTWSADEMSAAEIDRTTFAGYLGREEAIFREMKLELIDTLPDDQKTPLNRFYAQSQVYPQQFQPDWNRSFVLLPEGTPRGAAVLLHGLTDSPYSVRYLAKAYQQEGFVAVVPRLPGHGTAPGSLTAVDWQQWMATTRLAVREATRLAGANVPLHVIGYSNGGALALKYALDALDDKALPPPQQIVLLSPMIGVTAFARFAGLTGLPAVFPAFARAAWLNVVPEFNPYKYNSFPVKAARQSWLLTQALQAKIVQDSRSQRLAALAPVLTFQSVMDSTVSTRAVVDSLYRYLPENGSELVIFDINQAASLRSLLRPTAYVSVNALLPPPPRRYTTTVVTNASAKTRDTVARTLPAGAEKEQVTPLATPYPADIYSLSHVSLPFPPDDDLYGTRPVDPQRFGINLGNVALRGETGVLIVGMDAIMRLTANPFYDYMAQRIAQTAPSTPAPAH